MMFTLTYARTIILTVQIEASDEQEAYEVAYQMETDGRLGLDVDGDSISVKDGSVLSDIQDDETVWDISEL